MTAALAYDAPEQPSKGKHRKTKPGRSLHLPSLPRRKPRVGVRVTPTGQALYSVDTKGEATTNLLGAIGNGIQTFAVTVERGVDRAYPDNWFVRIFESEDERRSRENAQLFAAALSLVASLRRK